MKITSLFYHISDHEDTRLCANKAHMLHLTSQTQVQPNAFLKLEQILVIHIKITSLFYYIQTIRLHSFICKSHKNGQDPK